MHNCFKQRNSIINGNQKNANIKPEYVTRRRKHTLALYITDPNRIRDKKFQHGNKPKAEVKDYLKAKGWKTGRAALAPRMERPGLRPGAGKSRTRYALLVMSGLPP